MGGGDEFLMLQKGRQERHLQFISKERLSDSEESYRFTKQKREKLLGVFSTGALPYTIDRTNILGLQNTPTLSEMTKAAIDQLKDHKEGFVLQVEGGKVDWAAHANDVAALIHDQLAFEEAVKP